MYNKGVKYKEGQLAENQQRYGGGIIFTAFCPATVSPVNRCLCQNSEGGY